jgi:hypothetical protein
MQHSLRPTTNNKDKYVLEWKTSVHVAANVGNIGQRRAAYVFCEKVTCVVAELLQYHKCRLP